MYTKAKAFSDAYPFDKPIGVHMFLKHRDNLRESCYLHGGVDVLNMLIDFEAIEVATPLTEKQREILEMYYRQGYTQKEIAEIKGLAQQVVCDHIGRAVVKLARSYADLMGGVEID